MPSAVPSHSHRPTTKANNKAFKSKKATKSALRDQAKGKLQMARAVLAMQFEEGGGLTLKMERHSDRFS